MRAVVVAVLMGCAVGFSTLASAAEEAKRGIETDIVYGHKDGLAMTMDVYHPEGEANGAAVLFMVSGGWYSRWMPPEQSRPLFQPYLKAGYTMFAVRHGSSPRYSIPEAVSDVKLAVRHVREHAGDWKIDSERLGVMGMSAGGHLALMLGTTGNDGDSKSRVQAVVALVPPTDLRVAVWDAPESLPAYRNFPALNLPVKKAAQVSPLVHVTKDDAPALVMMGGADELVPPKHGEWIDQAFEKTGVAHKLIVFEKAGHNLATPNNHKRLIDESVGWFDKYLAKKP